MPIPQSATAALESYLRQPLSGKPMGAGASDVAKYILLNSQDSKAMGPGDVKNDPSWMSKVFDLLSRPNYAVANVVKDMANDQSVNPIKSAISGLAGTQKTTFQDVLTSPAINLPHDKVTAGLGLGMDILLDPTTYIPGKAIASVFKGGASLAKGLVKGGKVTEAVDKGLPAAEKALRAGEPINPELYGLPAKAETQVPEALKPPVDIPTIPEPLKPKPGFTTPQSLLDFPGMPKSRIQIPESLRSKLDVPVDEAAKEAKGQLPFKIPGFKPSQVKKATAAAQIDKATQIVAGLEKGNIEDALKIAPVPKVVPTARHIAAADAILSKFNPDRATAIINKLYPDTLNAKQQVKLWHSARIEAAKQIYRKGRNPEKVAKETYEATRKIYQAAEDKLGAAGKTPRIGTGDNVKLSDVIDDLAARKLQVTDQGLAEFSTALKPGSEISGAVERLRARGAITDSTKSKSILDAVQASKELTKNTSGLSDVQALNYDKFLKGFSKYVAKDSLSPAGTRATDKLVNAALDSGKSAAYVKTQQMAKQLDEVVATGKANLTVNKALTLALEKDLGKLPKWSVSDNKAMEWVMSRVSTWWGQQDLRAMSLNAIASAAATAEARGKVLNKMFTGFDATARAEAFRLAQGIGTASVPANSELAKSITVMMDDLTSKVGGASVLVRSGVNMDELNKWMRRYGTKFQFSKAQKFDSAFTGEKLNFSKGTDWLQSWKAHDIKDMDPAEFMYKMMQATEQATREKSLFEDLGERFGSSVFGKGYTTKIEGHPYLEGYHFPPEIAKQIPRVVKDWSLGTPNNNNMLRLYDKVLSMWKTLATIYRPAHHVRNLIGDVYLGMMDGVNSVVPYKLALKVQRSMKGAYDTIQDIDKMVEIGVISQRELAPLPGKVLFSNKSGVKFTAEQIAAVAHQKGLFEHARTHEDIIDLGQTGGGIKLSQPLGGHVAKLARGASELEAHNTRLAHFIDVVRKSNGNDLPKIFEEASRRSRKFHPSGIDMTDFERNVLRRIIPFYSWLRKSTPLLLEGMVMNPSVTVLPAKIGEALQQANGIDTTRDQPFPVDQMFPEWLRDEGIGPIGLPDGALGKFSNQTPPGYVQAGVGLNPLSQLLAQIQHPGKTLGSGLTPAIQIPLELGITGRKTFTGEPITGPDAAPGALNQYIGEQIPIWSAVQGITGITPAGTQTKKADQSNNQSGREALINWLTGLGIKGTGPYVKSALFEKKAPIQAQHKAAKADFLSQLRDQIGQ